MPLPSRIFICHAADIPSARDASVAFVRKAEPYLSLFPDADLERQADIWRDRSGYLAQPGTEIATLLFCLPDGLKTLLMRGDRGVYLIVLRSTIEDPGYQDQLSAYLGCESGDLEKLFQIVPQFSMELKATLEAEFAKRDSGPTQASWDELSILLDWYRRRGASTYALDIRVFAVMRALRQVFCDLALHVVVIERWEPGVNERALTRLFVYHTREIVPQRPPIYACCTTRCQLEALQAARSAHEQKVSPQESFVARAAQRIGAFRFRSPIHVFVCDTEDGLCSALLEVSGANAGLEDVGLARRTIEAALDPTDNLAVQHLIDCAGLVTPRQVRDFNRLLFVYSQGLSSPHGVNGEADRAWLDCLKSLQNFANNIPAASVSLSASEKLRQALQLLKLNGRREELDRPAFDHAFGGFKEELEASRAPYFQPAPKTRAS